MCLAAEYEWPSSKRISSECKDLVSRMLVTDPKHRIAIADIQVCEDDHHQHHTPSLLPCVPDTYICGHHSFKGLSGVLPSFLP